MVLMRLVGSGLPAVSRLDGAPPWGSTVGVQMTELIKPLSFVALVVAAGILIGALALCIFDRQPAVELIH